MTPKKIEALEGIEITLEITKKSKTTVKFELFGFSIRYFYGDMSRPIKEISVSYQEITK